MPITSKTNRRLRRRRHLWMLCLIPTIGCASSQSSGFPWISQIGQLNVAEEAPVAVIKPPLLKMAAFRAQESDGSEFQLNSSGPTFASLSDADEQIESLPPLPQIDSKTDAGMEIEAGGAALSLDASVETLGSLDPQSTSPPIPASPQIIDMASALGMAGGNAWTIQLARQKTVEAHADLQQAKALWLPTLQFGVGWNKHEGRIQATDGDVLEVSRGSWFVGGGATLGTAPVAGGSGGPLRLFADLALADAFFSPKIANRQLSARRAGISVAKNEALLSAGLAYVDLLEAAGQVADSEAAIDAANELLKLTQTFAEAGAGAQADVDRAATSRARLEQQRRNATRMFRTRSATLARRLRLDPRFELLPADQVVLPIELLSDTSDQESLIRTALSRRPEVSEISHDIAALCLAVQKEQVAPWIPHVSVTSSAGNFGGGNGSTLENKAGRSDLDLQALWQLESLGLGVAAKRNRAGSRLGQRRIELSDIRDAITASVVT
ncbi:MAG: TolC family protein, partial [Rubripirellula sp.]